MARRYNGSDRFGQFAGAGRFLWRGKIAAFGDSNGFFAMQIETDHEHKLTVGMNDPSYDWKNFVLNTFDWLASD